MYWYETEERAMAPGCGDGWPEVIQAPHTSKARLVRREGDPAEMQREIDYWKGFSHGDGEVSDVPCCRCKRQMVEFYVPNEAWNTITRGGGKKTDQEYLCLNCFVEAASDRIKHLQLEIDNHPRFRKPEPGEVNLYDYRAAIGGDGPYAATWKAKPHRLVYDLCGKVEHLQRIISGDPHTPERCPLCEPRSRPPMHEALCEEVERLRTKYDELKAHRQGLYKESLSIIRHDTTIIGQLRSIVAKLPKCWRLNDAGELVQDCPVVPGMILWLPTDSEIGSGRVVSLNESLISLTNGWVQHPDAYCNSLKAAEQYAEETK